jgi:hypothetical protein
MNAPHDGRYDFDFIHGSWHIDNRKIVDVLDPGCDEWIEFAAVGEARPLLDGLGNIDTFNTDALPPTNVPFHGFALRLFDPAASLWRIWWGSTRNPGHLDPPLEGRFDENGDGHFIGDDTLEGRPIKVRFHWQASGPIRWEQAFSYDDGATWQLNWQMTFTRKT